MYFPKERTKRRRKGDLCRLYLPSISRGELKQTESFNGSWKSPLPFFWTGTPYRPLGRQGAPTIASRKQPREDNNGNKLDVSLCRAGRRKLRPSRPPLSPFLRSHSSSRQGTFRARQRLVRRGTHGATRGTMARGMGTLKAVAREGEGGEAAVSLFCCPQNGRVRRSHQESNQVAIVRVRGSIQENNAGWHQEARHSLPPI